LNSSSSALTAPSSAFISIPDLYPSSLRVKPVLQLLGRLCGQDFGEVAEQLRRPPLVPGQPGKSNSILRRLFDTLTERWILFRRIQKDFQRFESQLGCVRIAAFATQHARLE